jgi:hypothetical protein
LTANLAAALMLAILMFFTTATGGFSAPRSCAATAALLHYLFLATWTLQLAKGWHLHVPFSTPPI